MDQTLFNLLLWFIGVGIYQLIKWSLFKKCKFKRHKNLQFLRNMGAGGSRWRCKACGEMFFKNIYVKKDKGISEIILSQ
jgi:hypothetical protein